MSVKPRVAARSERGQVMVIFAIMLPVFIAIGGIVIGVGNWYTHARHLQTKADAGAIAGGNTWAFPCGNEINARIATEARLYAGSQNPQVGGVPDSEIHSVLNGPQFYDDETNPTPAEDLANICTSMHLDVKLTEDDSFPLFSLLPVFPDIKRKAVVEIQKGEAFGGLLPIAVRAPVPLTAAVFYNETTGNIYATRYFVKTNGTTVPNVLGIPNSLQGWTTNNPEDPNTWASFTPASGGDPPARTGVLIAQSFREACNTNLPNPNTLIPVASTNPCFEDELGTVNALCNQGSIPVVKCFYASGSHPNQTAQAGLQFIRSYGTSNPGVGPPSIQTAWLESTTIGCSAYFTWQRSASSGSTCQAKLSLDVNVGDLLGEYGAPGAPDNEILHGDDVRVRFKLVRGDGTTQCANYGVNCDLMTNANGQVKGFETTGSGTSPLLSFTSNSGANAVAIQIQLRNVANSPIPACADTAFNNNCRWFYTGSAVNQSVEPTDAQILADPVQRGFRGNSRVHAGSVQWLRLTADHDCTGGADDVDGEAASEEANGCYFMEMGLRGGIAQDADEGVILFDDGTGSSQTGTVDCDPNVPQGQALSESIENGCGPWYAKHGFDTTPLCPDQNSIFTQPNPGPPWDGWPPLTCVKTRPTSTPSQMETGFDGRFFGGNTNSCPSDNANFVQGRNYWNVANNPLNAANPDPAKRYGYKDDNPVRDTNFHPSDKRVVTIYLVPPDTFGSSGQETFPIAGFIQVYVTGYGRVQNGGNLSVDDPCPGSTPQPSQNELDCQGTDCGYVVWGHFLNYVVPGGGADPSGEICDPLAEVDPCVPVLVE